MVVRARGTYALLRRRMTDPYGTSLHAMFGATSSASRPWWRVVHCVAPYLATPLGAVAREIRQAGCKAIICQEYESPRFDATILIGAWLKIPVFATFQGGTWHRSGLERRLRPHTLARSAKLIIASGVEADRVRGRYGVPQSQIARIFNPLDLSDWQPEASVTQPGPRRAGEHACGDLAWTRRYPRKGLDVLLEAWRRVCAERPQEDSAHLMGPASTPTPSAGTSSGPRPKLRWISDYVLDKLNPSISQRGDVYVLPSRHEGFPVAPLEAMACGASSSGLPPHPASPKSSPTATRRVAWSCPSADPTALCRAVGKLLDNRPFARVRDG